jgi:hypothetical protein
MQEHNLSGQELVSYSNGGLTAGGYGLGDYSYPNYYETFHYYYPQWYPTYHYVTEKSKIEQAFKILGKLLELKIVEKELTVKEFMKMVNEIAEVL